MSKTYTYKDGYITQKPEMEKPRDFFPNPNYQKQMKDYNEHLTSLPRYAAPASLWEKEGIKKDDLVEDVDFYIYYSEGKHVAAPLPKKDRTKEEILKKYRKRGNYLREHYHIQESDALLAMEEYKSLSDSRVKELEGEIELHKKHNVIIHEKLQQSLNQNAKDYLEIQRLAGIINDLQYPF